MNSQAWIRRALGPAGGAFAALAALVTLALAGCPAGDGTGGGTDLGLFNPGTGTGSPQLAGEVGGSTNSPLRANPGVLDFGEDVDDMSFSLRNASGAAVNFQIAGGADWVSTDSADGRLSAGAATTVHVQIDRAAMAEGAQETSVTITADGTDPISVAILATAVAPTGQPPQPASSRLRVTPSSLEFGSATRSRSLLVRNAGPDTLEFVATADSPWISLTGATGSSSGEYKTVRVEVARTGLTAGEYNGNVTVTAGDEQAVIPVHMTVSASSSGTPSSPQLEVSHTSLDFGQNQTRLVVLARNAGQGSLSYTVQSSETWATALPASGTSSGRYNTIAISVSRVGRDPGDYNATLTVAADNGQSHQIAVHMVVAGSGGGNPPSLEVSSNILNYATTLSELSFTVRNSGGGTLGYTVTVDSPWATPSPAQGTSAGEVDIVRCTIDRSQLEVGTHAGVLTIITDTGFSQQIELLVVQPGSGGGNPPTVTAWPSSDSRLDSLANFQHYAVPGLATPWGYNPNRWNNTPVIQQLAINMDSPGLDYPGLYAATYGALMTANPNATWCATISAGDCRRAAERTTYPAEMVAYELMPPTAYRAPYDEAADRALVNLIDPVARNLFADLLVQEILPRNCPGIFLDNVRHPMTGGTNASWPAVCDFLQRIRAPLHEAGTKTLINLATIVYFMQGADADLFAASVDGVNLEAPFHWDLVRPFPGRVETELWIYRRWLDAGMHIDLMAAWSTVVNDPALRHAEQRTLAALAMIIRQPGHSLSVPRTYFEDTPDWVDWPMRFGMPLDDYLLEGTPPMLSREFEHATVTVDLGASMDPARATSAVTVVWR